MLTFEQFYKEFLAEAINPNNEDIFYYSVTRDENHISTAAGYPVFSDQNPNVVAGILKTPSNTNLIDSFKQKTINHTTIVTKPALGYWLKSTDDQNTKNNILHAARDKIQNANNDEKNLFIVSREIAANLGKKYVGNSDNTLLLNIESGEKWNRNVMGDIQAALPIKRDNEKNIQQRPAQTALKKTFDRKFLTDLRFKILNRQNFDTGKKAFYYDILSKILNENEHENELKQIYLDANEIVLPAHFEINNYTPKVSKDKVSKLISYCDNLYNINNTGRVIPEAIPNYERFVKADYEGVIRNLTRLKDNEKIGGGRVDSSRVKKDIAPSITVFLQTARVNNQIAHVVVIDDNINQGDTYEEINNKIIATYGANLNSITWIVGIMKINPPMPPQQQAVLQAQIAPQAQQDIMEIKYPIKKEDLAKLLNIKEYRINAVLIKKRIPPNELRDYRVKTAESLSDILKELYKAEGRRFKILQAVDELTLTEKQKTINNIADLFKANRNNFLVFARRKLNDSSLQGYSTIDNNKSRILYSDYLEELTITITT
jgi:hypothetical protein